MPSSGQKAIDMDVAADLANAYEQAREYGLQVEFMAWFIGGIVNDELEPRVAANGALVEWDL